MGVSIAMVIQVALYQSLIGIARLVRFVLNQLMILQRLPFIAAFSLVIIVGRLGYSLFKWHRWMVVSLKYLLRAVFFFRGIRFTLDVPNHRSLASMKGIHICNDGHHLYWVLFAFLPYDHLIVPVDQFFNAIFARNMLFLIGFFPQEHGITPENLHDFDSRLSPYLAQGFSVWQPIFFEYRDQNPIPYALVLGLKLKQSVNMWKLYNSDHLERVHWLNRRTVQLTFLNQLPISRRLPLTIAAYQECVGRYFGQTLTQKYSKGGGFRSSLSKKEIAKQTFESSKKDVAGPENEAPTL